MTTANRPPATLRADGVWKIFGPRPEKALALADAGASRVEVLTATGNTIGVRDASFEALGGQTFVIMGLSGSGKSTLLRCVAGLVDVTRGSVFLDDRDLTTMSDAEIRQVRRDKLSMVFQHFGLFPHRRVIDNVAYGLEVQGIGRAERHQRAKEVLDLVGLQGSAESYPQQLSGGMQQRVGLARALAVDPSVLFFDEPFSALDPLIRRDMQNELLRIQSELSRTIVFVTHDFDEAIRLGDRIAIMKDGEFDQIGTAAELIAFPATDYVTEFTKDISRAKVLTAGDVIRRERQDTPIPTGSTTVLPDASIESFLPLLVGSGEDIFISSNGREAIGVIDRAAVSVLLGGRP